MSSEFDDAGRAAEAQRVLTPAAIEAEAEAEAKRRKAAWLAGREAMRELRPRAAGGAAAERQRRRRTAAEIAAFVEAHRPPPADGEANDGE